MKDNGYFKMSDKMYKFVKYTVAVFLPALSVCYAALSGIWGFPLPNEVAGTIAAVQVFLSAIFLISDAEYNKQKVATQQTLEEIVAKLTAEREAKAAEETKEDSSPSEPAVEPEVVSEPVVEETPTVTEATTPTEEERGIGGSCICEVNGSYDLTCNVKIRESYGTDARWKDRTELSEDGQAHCVEGDKAVLAAGTNVTCLEIYKNWIRIPSGWMCARDLDGTENVQAASSGAGKWCYPVDYIGISTGFSYEHMAYDFGWSDEGGGRNCNIYSCCDGTVLATGEAGTAGKYIYILGQMDGQEYTFRYCHLSAIHVSPWQTVSRHQHIGQMGGTGGFAEHLHMDIWTGRYDGVMPSDRWAACRNYMLSASGEGHELLFLEDGQWAGDTTGQNYVFHHI